MAMMGVTPRGQGGVAPPLVRAVTAPAMTPRAMLGVQGMTMLQTLQSALPQQQQQQQPLRTPRGASMPPQTPRGNSMPPQTPRGGSMPPQTPRGGSMPPQTPRGSVLGTFGSPPATPSGRRAPPVLRPEDDALARRLVSMGLISSHALAAQFIAAAAVPQVRQAARERGGGEGQ